MQSPGVAVTSSFSAWEWRPAQHPPRQQQRWRLRSALGSAGLLSLAFKASAMAASAAATSCWPAGYSIGMQTGLTAPA